MKIASCKAKGRQLQKLVRDKLQEIGNKYGIDPDSIKSTPMASAGVDIQLSPEAKKFFKLNVECKNKEAINVAKDFLQHYNKYKNNTQFTVLIHAKNRTKPMITLDLDEFLKMYEVYLNTIHTEGYAEKRGSSPANTS